MLREASDILEFVDRSDLPVDFLLEGRGDKKKADDFDRIERNGRRNRDELEEETERLLTPPPSPPRPLSSPSSPTSLPKRLLFQRFTSPYTLVSTSCFI